MPNPAMSWPAAAFRLWALDGGARLVPQLDPLVLSALRLSPIRAKALDQVSDDALRMHVDA